MTHTILFRCDASDTIGFGHVIRSFALAEACAARGISPHFIVNPASVSLLRSLGAHSDTIHEIEVIPGTDEDGAATAALARELQPSWIALDGYSFTRGYQSSIRKRTKPARLLVIDDGVIDGFDCDIILNQNVGSENSPRYTEVHETNLLLGSSYTLFRKSFGSAHHYTVRPTARNITLTFGGADPHNLTAAILGGLVRSGTLRGHSTRVILGGAYRYEESLHKIPGLKEYAVEIVPFSGGIIEHFLWSDVVIAAAGSVAWELALLRIPMVLIVAADNQQRAVAEPLSARGAALVLGDYRSFNPDKAAQQVSNLINDHQARLLLSARCNELIDCHGAHRVVDAMEQLQ
jgi:UDP-2,4-diacetamido-2,4,6-trideoxy-beta-L-altropyranose hydrolase